MDAINTIAARHGNIAVIEDAAQSFGAIFKGRRGCNLSTLGSTGSFSSKPLGCYGDGRVIFTNDDALAQACREIRVHGQSGRYHHTRVGVGGRMDTLRCAVLLGKLDRFDWEAERRRALGQRYCELLRSTGAGWFNGRSARPGLRVGAIHVFVEGRVDLQIGLKELSVPTAVHCPKPSPSACLRNICRTAARRAKSPANAC